MKITIDTPKGKYTYKYVPVYNGVKLIDKEIAKENLLLFKKIASKYDFTYGLAYGSLLGALREHDFIDHDEDIDMFALRSQLDVFKTMLWELRQNDFELIRLDRTEAYASIMRKGEYIDFYFFRPMQYGYWEAYGYPIPEHFITNLKEIEFQGEKFLAPTDAEDTMLFFYGTNWMTPIQYNNYNMNLLQKLKTKIRWYLYYSLPIGVCKKYLRKRLPLKIETANKSAERYNKTKGREVLQKIPMSFVNEFVF